MIDLGEIIRFHRERRGWKQSELALRLEELGLIAPGLRLRLREQLRAYYRAHPDAMEPHPSAPSINPATIGEGKLAVDWREFGLSK